MTIPGEVPQSNALAEATIDSLAELLSRDPEGYTRQDRTRVIEALRAQREKWAAAEAAAPAKRLAKGSATPALLASPKTAEELDL